MWRGGLSAGRTRRQLQDDAGDPRRLLRDQEQHGLGYVVDGWDALGVVDDDLSPMTREQLVVEVVKLRAAIRQHRDSSGHDLCWHHPDLWGTLPEQVDRDIAVPPWPQFLRGCVAYRQSLDRELPDAPTHVADFEETDR